MKHFPHKIEVIWEFQSVPDAEARIEAAFDLILSKPTWSDQNLTENETDCIMLHDNQEPSVS